MRSAAEGVEMEVPGDGLKAGKMLSATVLRAGRRRRQLPAPASAGGQGTRSFLHVHSSTKPDLLFPWQPQPGGTAPRQTKA